MKKFQLLEKINEMILILLVAAGSIAVYYSGYIDMGSNQLGNTGVFYLGAVSLSLSLLFISKSFFNRAGLLSMFGRHTILVLGFNYLIKDSYAVLIRLFLPKASFILNSWYVSSMVVIFLFGILIAAIEKAANRKSHHHSSFVKTISYK